MEWRVNQNWFVYGNPCGILWEDCWSFWFSKHAWYYGKQWNDLDYQGHVCVVLFYLSIKEFVTETGNCIKQVIIERCFKPKFVEVSEFAEEKTKRRERSFGSLLFNVSFFFQLLKKLIEKMESTYPNFCVFEKTYQFNDIKDLYYKHLNTLSLICFKNGYFYCFCNGYEGCEFNCNLG